MVVFDLTNKQSIDIIHKYVQIFREECPADASNNIVLVGNKVDEIEKRVIEKHEAVELVK